MHLRKQSLQIKTIYSVDITFPFLMGKWAPSFLAVRASLSCRKGAPPTRRGTVGARRPTAAVSWSGSVAPRPRGEIWAHLSSLVSQVHPLGGSKVHGLRDAVPAAHFGHEGPREADDELAALLHRAVHLDPFAAQELRRDLRGGGGSRRHLYPEARARLTVYRLSDDNARKRVRLLDRVISCKGAALY